MAMAISIEHRECPLDPDEGRQIRRRLERFGERLAAFPEPVATVVLKRHELQRRVEATLRIELGPLGEHLISHQAAETAPHALRLAVEDTERQLERRLARQRGEHTFGVPSRRLPKADRPHPPATANKKWRRWHTAFANSL